MAVRQLDVGLARRASSAGERVRVAWWPAALGVATISFWTAWFSGTWGATQGDYSTDYTPAMNALLDGHLRAFFANLPTNGAGGSLLLRAPFALLGKLLVGDQLAIFRFASVACLLALGALGLLLAQEMARRGLPAVTRLGVLALYAGTPALLEAVYYGHPEEPLGAALCIAAVLAASNDRPMLAGSLLGAAIINKPWGVLAIAPVVFCAREKRRQLLLPACAIIGGWFLSAAVIDPSRLMLAVHGAETGLVAHPQDLWWPLAHTVGAYPLPPQIVSAHARQLAVVLALLTAAALALRSYRQRQPITTQQCLALLAFGFALRCLLEPAPHDYYEIPLVLALAAWEGKARSSIAISITAACLLAIDFRRLNELDPTIPYTLYLAILLPISALLLTDIFGGPRSLVVSRQHGPAHISRATL